jgi:hypothetical protein
MTGGTTVVTLTVKLWVPGEPMPLLALIVNVKGEPLVLSGVPDRVAVLAPTFVVSEAQGGKLPEVALKEVTTGAAVAVTVKVPGTPTANEALFALVITGLC